MTEEKETKKEVEFKEFKLVEVTTKTAPAVQTPDGKIISESQLLVDLANEIREVKNLVG